MPFINSNLTIEDLSKSYNYFISYFTGIGIKKDALVSLLYYMDNDLSTNTESQYTNEIKEKCIKFKLLESNYLDINNCRYQIDKMDIADLSNLFNNKNIKPKDRDKINIQIIKYCISVNDTLTINKYIELFNNKDDLCHNLYWCVENDNLNMATYLIECNINFSIYLVLINCKNNETFSFFTNQYSYIIDLKILFLTILQNNTLHIIPFIVENGIDLLSIDKDILVNTLFYSPSAFCIISCYVNTVNFIDTNLLTCFLQYTNYYKQIDEYSFDKLKDSLNIILSRCHISTNNKLLNIEILSTFTKTTIDLFIEYGFRLNNITKHDFITDMTKTDLGDLIIMLEQHNFSSKFILQVVFNYTYIYFE